jgi:hypothetical protein
MAVTAAAERRAGLLFAPPLFATPASVARVVPALFVARSRLSTLCWRNLRRRPVSIRGALAAGRSLRMGRRVASNQHSAEQDTAEQNSFVEDSVEEAVRENTENRRKKSSHGSERTGCKV